MSHGGSAIVAFRIDGRGEIVEIHEGISDIYKWSEGDL